MPRPNRDRVMVSFYLERAARQAIRDLAEQRGETQADTVRALLAAALERAAPAGAGAAAGARPAAADGQAPDMSGFDPECPGPETPVSDMSDSDR